MGQGAATIVVVDDSSEVRLLVKTRLRLSGHFSVVGEGGDGKEAVRLAQEHHPVLMLLDVSMPGMDGLEALPRVREVSPGTRVVLYSGFEEQELVEKAAELGAAAFIEKSAPVDSLVDRLRALAASDGADETNAPATEERSAPVVAEPSTSRAESTPRPGALDPAVLDERVLDEHLERFHEVFEEAAIGMATMTLTGRLVHANRALGGLVGRSATELVGLYLRDLVVDPEGLLGSALDEIRSRPLDVIHLEPRLAARTDRQIRATLAPVRDSQGRPLYLFLQVQDITAERSAVEELRKSEERFRMLVEAVEDYAIFMLDPTGHIMSWNNGAQRSKGYTAEDIIGQHFRVFYPPEVQARRHPEHELEIALREGHYEEEGWRVRKDGSWFWANVLITAVFNDSGEHIGFAKVTRDTSQRRRLEQEREQALEALAAANAELESLNERLKTAAEEQAQLLAVTAHELRTPIGVLGGSADMLSKHWTQLTEEERTELFESMASSTGRLRRLLSDLLTASRLQANALEVQSESVSTAEVVADVVARLNRTTPGAEVLLDVPTDLVVSADRDRLAQALDNLVANAFRHGSPPVRITASTNDALVDIRISDEGPGVAEAVRPRLFERFATGQRLSGTGLGLFIVRELARAQGGDAFYDSPSEEEPAGAFVLRLPRAGAPV